MQCVLPPYSNDTADGRSNTDKMKDPLSNTYNMTQSKIFTPKYHNKLLELQVLCYWAMTTEQPPGLKILYVLHRWYWVPQSHTWQPLTAWGCLHVVWLHVVAHAVTRALVALVRSLGFHSQQVPAFSLSSTSLSISNVKHKIPSRISCSSAESQPSSLTDC